MMKWIKKGLIFSPSGQHEWVQSHAMLPVADHIQGDIYRIYFSGRDKLNRSLVGYVEIDINNPKKILKLATEPVLGLGSLGAFDDNGVSPTCIVNLHDKKYLYYFGWNKGSNVRAAEVSGLAITGPCNRQDGCGALPDISNIMHSYRKWSLENVV